VVLRRLPGFEDVLQMMPVDFTALPIGFLLYTVRYNGITQREDVLERAQEHMPNLEDFRAMELFEWDTENIREFGFGSPAQAAIAVELVLHQHDVFFERGNAPGIHGPEMNASALAVGDLDPEFVEFVIDRLIELARLQEFL